MNNQKLKQQQQQQQQEQKNWDFISFISSASEFLSFEVLVLFPAAMALLLLMFRIPFLIYIPFLNRTN